eukprot:scaffold62912_cov32-Tisochrysis_lutea.AAC.2
MHEGMMAAAPYTDWCSRVEVGKLQRISPWFGGVHAALVCLSSSHRGQCELTRPQITPTGFLGCKRFVR